MSEREMRKKATASQMGDIKSYERHRREAKKSSPVGWPQREKENLNFFAARIVRLSAVSGDRKDEDATRVGEE